MWHDQQSGVAATMCPGMQTEAVHLLLKWGADCKLKDHDGVSPIDTARHFPEILAAMHQQQVLATTYTLCYGYVNLFSSTLFAAAVYMPCCLWSSFRGGGSKHNILFSEVPLL